MFFQMCLPGLVRGLELGILSCKPYRLLSSCLGSDASPMCPYEAHQSPQLVPVEPRTLAHSSNLISCNFITGGCRQTSKGSHLEKYNCLSALTFTFMFGVLKKVQRTALGNVITGDVYKVKSLAFILNTLA